MKTKSKILTAVIILSLLYSCVVIKHPGHEYSDRLITGTTKNAYLTEDMFGRNAMRIHADSIDSARVGQWLSLKPEFKH